MNHWTRGSQTADYWLTVEVDEQPRQLWLRPISASYQKTWLCDLRKDTPIHGKKRTATFTAETPEEAQKKAEVLAVSWGAILPRGHRGPLR